MTLHLTAQVCQRVGRADVEEIRRKLMGIEAYQIVQAVQISLTLLGKIARGAEYPSTVHISLMATKFFIKTRRFCN